MNQKILRQKKNIREKKQVYKTSFEGKKELSLLNNLTVT